MPDSSDDDTNSDDNYIDLSPLWTDYPFITDYNKEDDETTTKKDKKKKKRKKRVASNDVGPPIILELMPIAEIAKQAVTEPLKKKGKKIKKKSKKKKECDKSHFPQCMWHPPQAPPMGPLEERPHCSYHHNNNISSGLFRMHTTLPRDPQAEHNDNLIQKTRCFTNLHDVDNNIIFTTCLTYSDSTSSNEDIAETINLAPK